MRARWYMVPMLLAALLIAAPAQAWSQLGHRIVGDLAELQLHEAARAEVQRLLAGEGEPTLGGVAAWADALRHEAPDRFRTSSRWHYINARGGGCDFVASRDCAQGGCIVTAIEAQRRILADRGQTLAARRDALKFLVHFVGDIHQPLHAGPREDSGGNGFQVSLRRERASAGRDTRGSARATGTNLHTVWDSHLLASAGLARVQYVARLRQSLNNTGASADEGAGAGEAWDGDPMQWARESCALVETADIYPASRNLGPDYLETHRPLAERRIITAAIRLAALLNRELAPQGNRSRNR